MIDIYGENLIQGDLVCDLHGSSDVMISDKNSSSGLSTKNLNVNAGIQLRVEDWRVKKVKVGFWYTKCCELDAYMIDDEVELEEVKEDLYDFGECDMPYYIFETKEELINYFKKR